MGWAGEKRKATGGRSEPKAILSGLPLSRSGCEKVVAVPIICNLSGELTEMTEHEWTVAS